MKEDSYTIKGDNLMRIIMKMRVFQKGEMSFPIVPTFPNGKNIS